MKSISVALPISLQCSNFIESLLVELISQLCAKSFVNRIILVYQGEEQLVSIRTMIRISPKVIFLEADSWISAATMVKLLSKADADALLLGFSGANIQFERQGIERFLEALEIHGAGMVYSNYRNLEGTEIVDCATASYQEGTIRDSFDFGPIALISTKAAVDALDKYGPLPGNLRWNGFYDLRLKLSIDNVFLRVAEPLYARKVTQTKRPRVGARRSEESFYTVDRSERCFQIEAESVASAHLRRIGAYLESGSSSPPSASDENFPVIASIVIVTRNRELTLTAALESALGQSTSFSYNIIVVDDHSTDGTTELLRRFARDYKNIVHIIPRRKDLGIGGLWNEAIYSSQCGLYAVQLDSDDIYSHRRAVEVLVNEFSRSCSGELPYSRESPRYAMVLGSFTCVDEDLTEISPGIEQRLQLSRENLRNNLLCVEGPSAPRAFFVPVLRRWGFPNVSFGEDYAIALRIAREYDIGRVYESTYLVRHWRGNTTRNLPYGSVKSTNMQDIVPPGYDKRDFWYRLGPLTGPLALMSNLECTAYKDYLRTEEIRARKQQDRLA